MKSINTATYFSLFNEKNGVYLRIGRDERGRLCGCDPFKGDFPELLDVGIMGHCIHGKSGLCIKSGVECYQDGLHSEAPNMSLEDFRKIVEQCRNRVYQIALGGCGDPDQHENFEDILRLCRENGIVPNFTTSGFGMTKDLAAVCKKYCGAVAVSYYRGAYTKKALSLLLDKDVKTNIHFVLSSASVGEAITLLKERSDNSFTEGINAIIFLLHKPVGLGTKDNVLSIHDDQVREFFELIDRGSFPYKIGFDSCSVPALLNFYKIIPESVDSCEGARWSAYISPDMKLMPCIFDTQSRRWAVDLHTHTIEQAWNTAIFEDFRSRLSSSCPDCEKQRSCFGGCPIKPSIVLCDRKERTINENTN